MTEEEFLLEYQSQSKTTRPTQTMGTNSCCEAAKLNRNGSDNLDPTTCIMVDEFGRAQYMIITEDGRWVPAENY